MKISALVQRDPDWQPSDRLRLKLGSENAASLAASTPAGGTVVEEVEAWPPQLKGGLGSGPLGVDPLGSSSVGYGLGVGELGYGALGDNTAPRVLLDDEYFPTDVTGVLPVGVTVTDEAGNESAVMETVIGINDPPKGARDLAVAGTGTPGEAALTWTESPNV